MKNYYMHGLFVMLFLYIGSAMAKVIEIGECYNNKISNPGFPFLQNGVGEITWKVETGKLGETIAEWSFNGRVGGRAEYMKNKLQFNENKQLENFSGRILDQSDISYSVDIRRLIKDKLIRLKFSPTDEAVDNSRTIISDLSICRIITPIPSKKTGDKVKYIWTYKYYGNEVLFRSIRKQYETGILWSYKCRPASDEQRLRLSAVTRSYGISDLYSDNMVNWDGDYHDKPQNLHVNTHSLAQTGLLNSKSERAPFINTFSVIYETNTYTSGEVGKFLTDKWVLSFTGGTSWRLDITRDKKSMVKDMNVDNIELVCDIFKSGNEGVYNKPPKVPEPSVFMHLPSGVAEEVKTKPVDE